MNNRVPENKEPAFQSLQLTIKHFSE